jgi:hypothetical protein
MAEMSDEEAIRIAEAVRAACVRAALEGYESARMDGLCDEGALEVALDAVRGLNVRRIAEQIRGRGTGPHYA